MEVEAIDVTKDFDPDPELNETLEKYTDVVEGKMGEVLGEFKCDLDGRFSSVRTKETNLGNLVSVRLPALHWIQKRKKNVWFEDPPIHTYSTPCHSLIN